MRADEKYEDQINENNKDDEDEASEVALDGKV